MHFPASKIAVAEPLCPSCGQTTEVEMRACVSCGYGFEFAERILPYQAPELRKFIDQDHHLSREDIRQGQKALEKLRADFPQVTLCTCVADVPDGISISEFGFWLFNQSVPNGPRLVERRLHSILLCIDTKRQAAALTIGYGLDPFIADTSLKDCLTKIQKPLAAEKYGKAISKLCRALLPVLADGFQKASRSYMEQIAQQKQEHRRSRRAAEPANQLPPRRTETAVEETHHDHHV